jgi:hypothetical protein
MGDWVIRPPRPSKQEINESPSATKLCADTGVTKRREKRVAPTESRNRMPMDYDYTGMREQERNNYTVGELLDAINDRMIAKTKDLMKATEIGRGLLAGAICTADDQDNAAFFAAAYSFYGPLIDTVLEECDRDVTRDTITGRLRASR